MSGIFEQQIVAKGGIKIPQGAGSGLVWTSDASGNGSWAPANSTFGSQAVFNAGLKIPTGAAVGYVLTSDSAGVGSWQPVPTQAGIVLTASGDASGATDMTAMNNAVTTLTAAGGGTIYFKGNWNVPFVYNASWVVPAQTVSGSSGGGPINIQGLGNPVLMPKSSSAITGISYHRTSNFNSSAPYENPAGAIRDITLDLTLATGNGNRGLDVGDGMGYAIEHVWIKNAVGTGDRGLNCSNTNLGGNHFFCEKSRFQVFVTNCTDCVYITAGSGSSSWEYNKFDLMIIQRTNQRGVVIDGAALGGCEVRIQGNANHTDATSGDPIAQSGPNIGKEIAMISFINGGRLWNGQIWAKMEMNPTGGGQKPWSVYSDGTQDGNGNTAGIVETSGQITTGLGGSKMNGGECSFSGMWDSNDALPPGTGSSTAGALTTDTGGYGGITWPGFSVEWDNYGPDVFVYIFGGGVTSIHLGSTTTGVVGGCLPVRARQSIKVFGSGSAPTWVVRPAGHTDF